MKRGKWKPFVIYHRGKTLQELTLVRKIIVRVCKCYLHNSSINCSLYNNSLNVQPPPVSRIPENCSTLQ